MRKKTFFVASVLLACWLILSIISAGKGYVEQSKLPEKVYGKPTIIAEHIEFESSPVSQIVDDGTHLFIMVDSHRGYIQVYDLLGNYQETISLYEPFLNGVFNMATDSDMLYVRDPEGNVYAFCSGEFIEFVSQDNVPIWIKEMNYKDDSEHYRIRFGSIWRIDEHEQTCVVQRSLKAIIYQYNLNWLITVIVLLFFGFAIKKRGTREPSPVL